jgi:thioredoxin-related protein
MKYSLLLILILFTHSVFSQEPVKIYNPSADAKAELSAAVSQAKTENKQVLIQVGGNWCSWCIRLHAFFQSNARVDSLLKADYVFMLINYSPENKNPELLASLGHPQRFGFPVLLVVDQNGQRIHTQDTGYLELDKGYDPEKVTRFLENWSVSAVKGD